MNKWVCITNKFKSFKYGDIYDGEIIEENYIVGLVVNGVVLPVPLYITEENKNYKEIVRRYGAPKVRVYNFISLNEWRENQINKIFDNNI